MQKKILIIIGGLLVISIFIGTSYAVWRLNIEQSKANTLLSDCFEITLEETDPIELEKAYPVKDEEGKKLKPYTFKVINKCQSYAKYQIQLETINTSTLDESNLKVMLNEETPGMLNSKEEGEKQISNSKKAYILEKGYIGKEETKSYSLRLWLDESITMTTPGVQNSKWSGKISIEAIYTKEPTYCELHPETGACTIMLKGETTELKFDNTVDNNIRYIGKDPNNYVTFNNELWRIIGVMNNVEDGSGTKVPRIKLIKAESIGNYSWDNKASGTGSSTSSAGSNDWSDSTLQEVLNNGAYYNRTSGTCPSGSNGATTACDFTSKGLTPEAKTMIENIKWNLGGSSTYNDVTASMFYERERGTTVYSGRPTEWMGKVGLMYPSDYGYATSGGATTNREACLAKELYNWDATEVSDCKNNDWLYDSSNWQWTLSPSSGSSDGVSDVCSTGDVFGGRIACITYGVSPAVYLLSETKISSGNGTDIDPFTLSL